MDTQSLVSKRCRDHEAEYREYLAFMAGAEEELKAVRGYGILPSEREEYSREFYAPSYRSETKI
ncbi:MAG: hypothetical protein ACFB50_10240 [Rubrobacteraceae bacterium]